MQLAGKVALVTGAARGIGRAIALRLAREGADVAVLDVLDQRPLLTELEDAGARALALQADVADGAQVEAAVARADAELGHVRLLVCNAGICPWADFFDIDEALWDRVQAVNAKGPFLCSQAVARRLVEAGLPGRIVVVSSASALVGGSRQVHYGPSKAAASALVKGLAVVLGPHGIACNAVLPGAVPTAMNRDDLTPEKRAYLEGRVPLGRLATPDDIAGAVAFLCSEDAAYLNGAEVLVDGGLLVNLQ